MLKYLHVKNLAVVEDIEVEFGDGLNILTGETGVGKSVIIGSINMALGGKVWTDMIRNGESYALVEMTFEPSEEEWEQLKEYDIIPEDNQLIISRKLVNGRSTGRVNGETVTVAVLKRIASILIDIHGQHEHQSLLYPENHIDIVDRYVLDSILPVKESVYSLYKEYCEVKRELDKSDISAEERQRELDFIQYEINEIESAALMEGEEERLEKEYKRLNNAGRIIEAMGKIYDYTGSDNNGASSMIGSAVSYMNQVAGLDSDLENYQAMLADIDNILSDFNRDVASYISDYSFDNEAMYQTEERLNTIRRLYSKFGGSYESVMRHYEEICDKRSKYEDYEETLALLKRRYESVVTELSEASAQLTTIRQKASEELKRFISEALVSLNFPDGCFDILFETRDEYSANGVDYIEFMIAANPGEPSRPLAKVASGGELSRIMLAIKSVLAQSDSIHTLVFDEIDTGISGRTAQMVSEKLAQIAKAHQIICITHLAQIASMADDHYVIEKNTYDGRTKTDIRQLGEEEITAELARIIGGTVITDSVMTGASEMKLLATKWKREHTN